MENLKIVFTGSMGAGKTTAIKLLSEISVVSTDVVNNDSSHTKDLTTVGIDFGYFMLDDNLKLSLYGTPGQQRFSFMWKIIAQGALGVIILIDASQKNALDNLKMFVDAYSSYGIKNIILGLTHLDIPGALEFSTFQQLLTECSSIKNLPIYPCDARNKDDIVFLLEILVAIIEAQSHPLGSL